MLQHLRITLKNQAGQNRKVVDEGRRASCVCSSDRGARRTQHSAAPGAPATMEISAHILASHVMGLELQVA